MEAQEGLDRVSCFSVASKLQDLPKDELSVDLREIFLR